MHKEDGIMHKEDGSYLAVRYYENYILELKRFLKSDWLEMRIVDYMKIEQEIKKVEQHVKMIRSILN